MVEWIIENIQVVGTIENYFATAKKELSIDYKTVLFWVFLGWFFIVYVKTTFNIVL